MNFRKYNKEDRVKVIELLNLCLSRKNLDQITNESFEWKHFDKYFENKTATFVAEVNTRIVSFVCFNPFELNDGEIIWNCSIQVTNPKFRRQGIVSKLTKLCQQGIVLISNKEQNSYLGFCNESGLQVDLNSKTIEHQIVGQFHRIIIFPSYFCFKNKTQSNENTELLTWNKNESYLNWKYENNPKIKYQKITNESWTIYYKESFFRVEIWDIVINADQPSEIISAINYVKKIFPTKIITMSYLFNSTTEFISKQKLLFSINRKIPIWLTVRSKNKQLLDNDYWLLFGGDII